MRTEKNFAKLTSFFRLAFAVVFCINISSCGGGNENEQPEISYLSEAKAAVDIIDEGLSLHNSAIVDTPILIQNQFGLFEDNALAGGIEVLEQTDRKTIQTTSTITESLLAFDTLSELSASKPIVLQTWRGVNCAGQTGTYISRGDNTVVEAPLPDGSQLRFGRTVDPLAASRPAFVFRVGTSDRQFSDGRRCEAIAYPDSNTALPRARDFWYAVTLLVDKGAASRGDDQLLTQWHALGFNPLMGLYMSNGTLRITTRHSPSSTSTAKDSQVVNHWSDSTTVPRRWMTFVFNSRISPDTRDRPFLRVWKDGTQIVNYQGPLGYYSPSLPYPRVGFYSWYDRNPWDSTQPVRTIYVKRAVIINDRGSWYSPSILRDWVERL